jgi:hypothetical protein
METNYPAVFNKEAAANLVEFAKLAQEWVEKADVTTPTPDSQEASKIAYSLLTRLTTYTELLRDVQFELRHRPYKAVKPQAQDVWISNHDTRLNKLAKCIAEFREFATKVQIGKPAS